MATSPSKSVKKNAAFYTQKLRIDKFEEPEYMATIISKSKDCEKVARHFFDSDTIEIFESFSIICLNKACKPISWVQLSQGGTSGTVADIKLIFAHALLCGASAIICVHNHPSGCLTPSSADFEITRKIKDGGNLLDVKLLDHLILTAKGYYSFADEGRI